MNQEQQIVIFGEVLFDCFEDGYQVLGGAPFNVAWNLKALGAHPLMISRIGRDDNGHQILDAMNNWGMSIDGIQVDEEHPTGVVNVFIENDEPRFDIVYPSAYDFIDPACFPYLSPNGIIYHGSLALRKPENVQALAQLLSQKDAHVFVDINLRPPWWESDLIKNISHNAHWIKLNEHELDCLVDGDNEYSKITQLFASSDSIKELILTQAEKGAMSLTPEGELHRVEPTPSDHFVDAVGAGDAFSSVVLLGKYLSWSNEVIMQRAQEFASAVVGIRGATTTDKSFYDFFVKKWNQE